MAVSRAPGSARRRAIGRAILLLATLAAANPASAYVITTNNGITTEGWDGPGRNPVTIDWYLGGSSLPDNGLPTGIALAAVEAEIMAAMATWSSYAAITWNYVGNAITNPEIDPFGTWSGGTLVNILWTTRDHGDLDPFDGAYPGGPHLAHAWGPPDVQLTVLEGDIHLDKDEHWVTTPGNLPLIDLQSVILHELGHVLGLAHSPVSSAVMNAEYSGPHRALNQDDVLGIQSLYQCPGEATGQACPTASTSTPSDPVIPGGGDPPGGGGGPQFPPIVFPPIGGQPVPEPGSLTLFTIALAAMYGRRRRIR